MEMDIPIMIKEVSIMTEQELREMYLKLVNKIKGGK